MSTQKSRWSKVYESSEEELLEFLRSRNIDSRRIVAEEADISEVQTTETALTIWCAEGSLSVRLASGTISLQPGDALRLPAKTTYSLVAGLTGYVCYVSA